MGKKRTFTKIVIGMLAICMCINFGTTVVKAWEVEPYPFEFSYLQDGVAQEYISDLAPKYSNSSMSATCYNATSTFMVHAVAIYYDGGMGFNQYKYSAVDVSNGYRYYLGAGTQQSNIYNWVNERGYNYAGLYCTYQGDNVFSANGIFLADQ